MGWCNVIISRIIAVAENEFELAGAHVDCGCATEDYITLLNVTGYKGVR